MPPPSKRRAQPFSPLPGVSALSPELSINPISRRAFLTGLVKTANRAGIILGGAGMAISGFRGIFGRSGEAWAGLFSNSATDELLKTAPAARYWISADAEGVACAACHGPDENRTGSRYEHPRAVVKCRLCAQECMIEPGERGRCNARMNVKGELRSLVYGRPVSIHVDPIEKKPLYHFLPGSSALSLATSGCPLSCKFCQNWEISQARPEDIRAEFVPPEAVVGAAGNRKAPIIAFTYNEPTVFTEYLLDIAEAARNRDLRSVLISCGYMNPEPLADMCRALDAVKIDLKGFDPDFYRKVCGAELAPVLRTLKEIAARGVHLEIVNLVAPTLNDSEAMLTRLVEWVAGELGPDVPIHFTRFHPDYRMRNLPPTPVATLERAYDLAKSKGIRHPYVGNVPGHPGNHTYCPSCGKIVIQRTGFFVTAQNLDSGRCRYCRTPIAGVWA